MTTLFDAVSGPELDRYLRAVARVVRLSGTPEEAEAFDYPGARLRAFGYDVARHQSAVLIGYPKTNRERDVRRFPAPACGGRRGCARSHAVRPRFAGGARC